MRQTNRELLLVMLL